jgi:hypothetical protein
MYKLTHYKNGGKEIISEKEFDLLYDAISAMFATKYSGNKPVSDAEDFLLWTSEDHNEVFETLEITNNGLKYICGKICSNENFNSYNI